LITLVVGRGDAFAYLVAWGWLLSLRSRIEVYEVAIGIAEVDRARPPWLGSRLLDPTSYQRLKPCVFLVHVRNSEFQNRAPVSACIRGTRDVFFLCISRKNCKYANTRAKFRILPTRPLRFQAENILVEVHKPIDVGRYQTGVDQNRIWLPLRVIRA